MRQGGWRAISPSPTLGVGLRRRGCGPISSSEVLGRLSARNVLGSTFALAQRQPRRLRDGLSQVASRRYVALLPELHPLAREKGYVHRAQLEAGQRTVVWTMPGYDAPGRLRPSANNPRQS